MQNESQLSKEILDCFVVVNTDQMGNARYDIDFNKLSKEFATARAEGAQEEREKHIEIYRWLVGYYDFPERQDGMGAYWWRSHLMDKLKNIGIEALTTKEHHAS